MSPDKRYLYFANGSDIMIYEVNDPNLNNNYPNLYNGY